VNRVARADGLFPEGPERSEGAAPSGPPADDESSGARGRAEVSTWSAGPFPEESSPADGLLLEGPEAAEEPVSVDAPLGLPADEAVSSGAGNWAGVCSEDEADAWEVNGLGPDPWAALLEGEGPEVNSLGPDPWAALLGGEGPEVNGLGLAPEAWAILKGEGPDLAVADAYDACCVVVNGGDEGTALWSAPPSGCANCPRALRWRPPLGVAMMMLFALASVWYP
jgi:hypothetical protein